MWGGGRRWPPKMAARDPTPRDGANLTPNLVGNSRRQPESGRGNRGDDGPPGPDSLAARAENLPLRTTSRFRPIAPMVRGPGPDGSPRPSSAARQAARRRAVSPLLPSEGRRRTSASAPPSPSADGAGSVDPRRESSRRMTPSQGRPASLRESFSNAVRDSTRRPTRRRRVARRSWASPSVGATTRRPRSFVSAASQSRAR